MPNDVIVALKKAKQRTKKRKKPRSQIGEAVFSTIFGSTLSS